MRKPGTHQAGGMAPTKAFVFRSTVNTVRSCTSAAGSEPLRPSRGRAICNAPPIMLDGVHGYGASAQVTPVHDLPYIKLFAFCAT